jgi:hypothetical protein
MRAMVRVIVIVAKAELKKATVVDRYFKMVASRMLARLAPLSWMACIAFLRVFAPGQSPSKQNTILQYSVAAPNI